MAALNPEAPPFYYYGRVPPVDLPFYTPTATQPFFDPPPSTPYYPSMSPSFYNNPNRSFLCSSLPYHPRTQKPFHGIHGNLHPTQQPVHPTLSFPQPHTEAQARGGDGAAEEREDDGAAHPHPITPTAPNYKRFKAPLFCKNGREDMQFQAVQGKVWVRKGSGKTTFMIKNIPYKYTSVQFLNRAPSLPFPSSFPLRSN
ncbi:hypothetical protein MRB53_000924 [Persea americana]|uniref:Uncharacterized protein n=1 Tax=Persea americana TaxID=3435 RepID=A0ACC2MR51_PERAE|nr:hypothetical protein MRB53_000924 [Persea americana]